MYPTSLQFIPFERAHAEAMLSWRYPAPYELYNSADAPSESAIGELLRPEFHYIAVLDEHDAMIAFRCFGPDAQVAGGNYRDEALDLGGGLRPDLTGQGLGRHVISAAMNYACQRFQPTHFRATVAAFNGRAKKTCERLGYHMVSTFTRPSDGLRFEVYRQDARAPALAIPLHVSVPIQSPPTTQASAQTFGE